MTRTLVLANPAHPLRIDAAQAAPAARAPLPRPPHRARLRLRRGAAARLAPLASDGFGAGHSDDGRKVDVLEVMSPVVKRGIERKSLALGRRHAIPHRYQVSRVEDAVDLRVYTVELDEVEAALQALALLVEVVREAGDAGSERQRLDRPLSGGSAGRATLPLA